MKKLLALFLILNASMAAAVITDKDEKFTSLCITEKSTGFHWDENTSKWVKRDFTWPNSIVKKQNSSACLFSEEANYLADQPLFKEIQACYNEKHFGRETGYDETCTELWKRNSTEDNFYLHGVNCKHLKFQPNGKFRRIPFTDFVDWGLNTDSLAVRIGNCSTF